MSEFLCKNIQKEVPFSVGDVVLVLRDIEEMGGREEGGVIHDIEPSGRVFIKYGGIVSLLHDEEQVRLAPNDIKEALALRLKQNEEELYLEVFRATDPLRYILEEYHQNDTFLKWATNSLKSILGRYGTKRS